MARGLSAGAKAAILWEAVALMAMGKVRDALAGEKGRRSRRGNMV